MRCFIGCDLGGTNLRVGLVDVDTGKVLHLRSTPTLARESQKAVVKRMAKAFNDILTDHGLSPSDVGGAGIGIPGTPDIDRGVVRFMPNFEGTWPDVPLRDWLLPLTGVTAYLLNDVRAITLGEWRFGAGVGAHTVACLALGTGVGGGVVIRGELHLGMYGTAGELGHQTVDPATDQRCGCGNRGCLEVFASGPAIAALGVKAVLKGRHTMIGELAGYDLNKITASLVAQAAARGDREACDIYRHAGHYLGVAIANIMVVVSPQRVIIGGGVARAGELLLEPARQVVRERVFMVPQAEIPIAQAQLGDDAGVIGAALWAGCVIVLDEGWTTMPA
jgi:glucokinase